MGLFWALRKNTQGQSVTGPLFFQVEAAMGREGRKAEDWKGKIKD